MNYFQNKVIWITGASSGIGKQLAIDLDKQGAKLILSSRKQHDLEQLKIGLTNHNNHVIEPLDLENSSNFIELAGRIVKHFGKIDMLINNGGISQRALASESSLEIDRKIMEINYFGNIALSKAVLPYFIKQKSGHFVVISSISGKFGFFLRSAYSASKHALHGFYESLALEEEKNNIFVSIICPGKINTNISVHALNSTGNEHGIMDHNQETGMSVEICVEKLLKAVSKQKREVFIGNKEIKAVLIKRLFPKLFWNIIRKQKAT